MQKIVFNGHYLTYIDTAIAEYWREIGLPYPMATSERYASRLVPDASYRRVLGSAATTTCWRSAAGSQARPLEHDLPFEIYREAEEAALVTAELVVRERRPLRA